MIKTNGSALVLPGDFAVVRMGGTPGRRIRIGQWLDGDGFADYEHAITYVGGPEDLILEAEPGGARIVPFHYSQADVLWSAVNPDLNLTTAQRDLVPAVCNRLQGVPYSAADYFALAAHRLHIPAEIYSTYSHRVVSLREYVAESGHQICSQDADYVRQQLNFQLFRDGRWNGYVTPADLANRIRRQAASF